MYNLVHQIGGLVTEYNETRTDISVLMCVYKNDNPTYFRSALSSIVEQSLPPGEIILVKDGALSIELEQEIEKFTQIIPFMKVIPLEKNCGLGLALNKGTVHCSCKYIARMDADDLSKPNRLEMQYQFLLQNPSIDIVGGWIREFNLDMTAAKGDRHVPELHDDIAKLSQFRSGINHVSVMFKKSAVEAVGGYSNRFRQEDYFLWIRLLLNKATFHNLQCNLVDVRAGTEMLSRRKGLDYLLEEVRLHRWAYSEHFINMFQFIRNVTVRVGARFMPVSFLVFMYKFFRTQVKQ